MSDLADTGTSDNNFENILQVCVQITSLLNTIQFLTFNLDLHFTLLHLRLREIRKQ